MSQPPMPNQKDNGKSTITINLDTDNNFSSDNISEENKKGNGLILGIFIGIIGTIIGVKLLGVNPTSQNPATSSPASITQQTDTRQTITTTTAKIMEIPTKIEANGTVLPYELIPVMSQSNNLQIKEVLVDEGDIVTQGQVLIRLDDLVLQSELKQAQAGVAQARARLAELKAGTRKEELQRGKENVNFAQADVAQSEADLQLAQTKLQRNRQLEAEGAIPRDRLDELINDESTKKSNVTKNQAKLREAKQTLAQLQKGEREEVIAQAEANLAEAQTKVKLVEAKLKDTIIKAPVNGKIAERNARVGDVTSSFNAEKLFTIIEEGKLELQVKVPENQLKDITSGQIVQIYSSANTNLKLTGRVRDINPVINTDSRQGIINVDLPSGNNLKPGMFLQTAIITTSQPRLNIPMTAVLPQSNGNGIVYVVKSDNTVEARKVSLGEIIDNQSIEILSGLENGDIVALKGINYLQDGSQVIIDN